MDATVTLSRLKYLVEQEFFSSAKSMSGLLISAAETGNVNPNCNVNRVLSQAYFYHAEGLVGIDQPKRAIVYYDTALSHYKVLKSNKTETSAPYCRVLCQVPIGKDLLSIQRFSECQINCQVYKVIPGENGRAVNAFKAVLKENPDCLECIEALYDLEANFNDIVYSIKTDSTDAWLYPFAQVKSFMVSFEYEKAFDLLKALECQYPSNIDIMLMIADCNLKCGRTNAAIQTYAQIHRQEPSVLDQMDRYAALLKNQGKDTELFRLAESLLKVSDRRPEPWLAMSRYLDVKDEKEKALVFIEKAIELAPNHRDAYLLKGSTLLGLERPSDACIVYRRAHRISRDLLSFQGLIESYIGLSRVKEALAVAKEAIQLMPKNPKMLTLVGVVLSHTPNGREKAKKAFENALAIDPYCTEAAIALVSTNIAKKEWKSSIQILENQLKFEPSDFLHTRLADIFSLSGDFSNALSHYNAALSINSEYERAVEGVMRVEKLMGQSNDSNINGNNMDEMNSPSGGFQSLNSMRMFE